MQKRLFVCVVVCLSLISNLAFSKKISDNNYFQKEKSPFILDNNSKLKARPLNFRKKDFSINFFKDKPDKRVYIDIRNVRKSYLEKLKENGVALEYVADNIYIIKVNSSIFNKIKKLNFVTGFAEVLPVDKLSENLYRKNFSNHAMDGNYIDLKVTFYEDVSLNEAIANVKEIGGIIISKQFSITHKLRVSIYKDDLEKLASLNEVKYIDEIISPLTTENIDAGKLSTVFWNDGGSLSGLFDFPYSFTGENINVAVKDGGAIYNHQDFGTRLTIVDNDLISNHATHVAGIIGGNYNSSSPPPVIGHVRGMASSVNLFSYSFFVVGTNQQYFDPEFTTDFISAIENYNASIVNNSWSEEITWSERDKFGDYNTSSEDMDFFIYDYFYNNALITKSAGNYRDDYVQYNYNCIAPIGCSKNTVTVGSIGKSGDEYESSDFSSWGPTDDGRIKPDIVADGYYLGSTVSNNAYGISSGTSQSTPVITGITALLFEAYKEQYGLFPTADIIKALLCNYADDLPIDSPDGPDYSHGFGLANAEATVQAILNFDDAIGGHIVANIIGETNDFIEYQFNIVEDENDNETITITLAWIDPAGNPAANKALVNDLDLIVYNDNETFFPYYLDKDNPSMPAQKGVNSCDTIEQVVIEADNSNKLTPGEYTIRISGTHIPIINQPFALVSSIGFNSGFHFNTLKVENEENEWVNTNEAVADRNPSVLLIVTELGDGFTPSTFGYKYATELDNTGTPVWSTTWSSVEGVYTDEDCSTSCGVTHTGLAYVKVENVPFNKVSMSNNKIKFKLDYDNATKESPAYIVKNHNYYYVSSSNGSDTQGTGTKTNPWQTITHAQTILQGVADENVTAEVFVQSGTYNEDILLREYINLHGSYDSNWFNRELDSETEMSIIQGSGDTHVIIGEDNTTLDGFVVTGGEANFGGGIYLYATSPVIKNCIIKNNIVDYVPDGNDAYVNDFNPRGGGVFIMWSSAKLINCKIKDNKCIFSVSEIPEYDYPSMFGAGVFIDESTIDITECVIEANICTPNENVASSYGAGICIWENSSVTIINSTLKNNKAYSNGDSKYSYGGAVFQLSSDIDLLGCLLYSNECLPSSKRRGDGIMAFYEMNITNCTIYGNSGEGIRISSSSATPYLTNCILWENGNDLYGSFTSSKVSYNCIQDGDFNGQNGNISVNPHFRDPDNENSPDFHIRITSPCIDRGNDNANSLNLILNDIDGETRKFEFDNDFAGSVDMGCDEYRWIITSFEKDNDSDYTLEWESISGQTYYIEYTDTDLNGSATWTRVQQGITGQTGTTSWTDDGTETSPPPDNEGVINRFYKVVFEN